jgi:peptidoglycan/xylan/chitin deacetylase (PgdA/CDA1 family)
MTGRKVVAILGYHKIGEPPADGWPSWFYVPERTFAAQLQTLADSGWPVIDLERFLRGLTDAAALPARAALLTFDDAYRSTYTVALPWLQRFAAPAVVFVPVDHVGGRNVFDAGAEPDEPICDWRDLRALDAAGVAVQSHAASHRRFSELSRDARRDEIARSRAAIERALERPVSALAFPYGDPGPDADVLLASAGYQAGFMYGGGPVAMPCAERWRIPRIAMGPDTDLDAVLATVDGEVAAVRDSVGSRKGTASCGD